MVKWTEEGRRVRDLHESCRRTIAASSFRAWAANLIARKTTGKVGTIERKRERERERHDDDEARHSLGIASKQVWRYLSGTTAAVTAALFNIVPHQDPSPPLSAEINFFTSGRSNKTTNGFNLHHGGTRRDGLRDGGVRR